MAVNMSEFGIDKLSVEDRITLLGQIWDSLAEEAVSHSLPEDLCREIDCRLAAHRVNPQAAVPWEQVEAEALARIASR